MSHRISPAQPVFGPENIISGVTRPYRRTNLWRSAPTLQLPQWVQLEWERAANIATVELTFPGHLIREHHAYGPLYRDPQCPRDYQIQVWEGIAWRNVLSATGNYQRHRRHALEKVTATNRLRVVVSATNGDPAAAIYEVRCY